jgi:hypothetical protein
LDTAYRATSPSRGHRCIAVVVTLADSFLPVIIADTEYHLPANGNITGSCVYPKPRATPELVELAMDLLERCGAWSTGGDWAVPCVPFRPEFSRWLTLARCCDEGGGSSGGKKEDAADMA